MTSVIAASICVAFIIVLSPCQPVIHLLVSDQSDERRIKRYFFFAGTWMIIVNALLVSFYEKLTPGLHYSKAFSNESFANQFDLYPLHLRAGISDWVRIGIDLSLLVL